MIPTEIGAVPTPPDATPRVAPDGPRAAPTPDSPPVLVVDGDAAAAAATQAALVGGGYSVAAEAEGDAVLRVVRASLVRLVVSELYVACAEGPCVVAALKGERARLPRLRVLVHTSHGRSADIEWALRAGADAVVPKPAATGVLLREVGRLLDRVPAA